MSMVTMTGRLVNTFKANDGKDPETGAIREGKDKIQVMGAMPMESGEARMQLIDLTCNELPLFKPLQGKNISFPVSATAMGGNLYWFIPKGSKPVSIEPSK